MRRRAGAIAPARPASPRPRSGGLTARLREAEFARFIVRRLALALITLLLLSLIIFFITNVLPNNVGRTILGPFAPEESVVALNERLGTDRPLYQQYGSLLGSMATFDYGRLPTRPARPVSELLWTPSATRPSSPSWPSR
jgi:hypothetical protein